MGMRCFCLIGMVWVVGLCGPEVWGQLRADGATASFLGSLPPKPVAALSVEEEAGIATRLGVLEGRFEAVRAHERAADAAILSTQHGLGTDAKQVASNLSGIVC